MIWTPIVGAESIEESKPNIQARCNKYNKIPTPTPKTLLYISILSNESAQQPILYTQLFSAAYAAKVPNEMPTIDMVSIGRLQKASGQVTRIVTFDG